VEGKRVYLCALACLALSQLAGCCCDNSAADFGADYHGRPYASNCFGPSCFGYHSTCWSPWPEECPNCPPPIRLPPTEELEPSPVPAVPPSAPAELPPANKQPSVPEERPLPQERLENMSKSTRVPTDLATPAANMEMSPQAPSRNILPRKSIADSNGS
jgi:hypothetical protein